MADQTHEQEQQDVAMTSASEQAQSTEQEKSVDSAVSASDDTPVEYEGAVQSTVPTVKLEDELKQSFIDYAMSVIVDRALPDVRDGLKPVHRRVLYDM